MSKTPHPSRLIPVTRSEQIRVRADERDRKPVVRLDLWEPLTRHGGMTVAGRPMFIPAERVGEVVAALLAAQAEAGQSPMAEAEGEF